MSLSKLIRKREVATVTVATHATVTPIHTPSVAIVASVNVANTEPDCLDTLATDYAELQTLIAELCRIVGHTEEAKANMLAACRNVTPAGIAEQRDYFRRLVELATAGKYWTSQTTQ